MTRTRWALVMALATTLLVGACGGTDSATATPPDTSPAATAGVATSAPAPNVGTGIGGAVTALEDLTSYTFAIGIAAEGTAGFSFVPSDGSMTISGTAILEPEIAMDLTMSTRDAAGAEAAFGYRIIGDQAYVSLGTDMWIETSAEDAQRTVESLKPGGFLSSFGSMDAMQPVGDEMKNGVSCTHYSGEAPAALGAMFGLPAGTWTTEAWVAKDGGYVVSAAVTGEAPDGTFTMTVDIGDFNSPSNTVEAPSDFTPMGG